MTQVAEAREMARNAQWPPMLDGAVDPIEVAAYLTGPRVPAEQIPGLLDLIEAGQLAETPAR